MADNLVKLVHAQELARWERFPAYEEHAGKPLAQHRAEVQARKQLESSLWRLIEAKRLVESADRPQVYRTETDSTPWPISLPGRRSIEISPPEHPETTVDPDIGQVKNGRLVVPLFIKERSVHVRYLARNRVAVPERVAEAEALLANASDLDLEGLRNYFGTLEPDPVLFVSHRWETATHPDPDGRQLKKLKALKDCYVIYDYTSFPQDTTTVEAKCALSQVLDAMDSFIDNLLVLSAPDYMSRGWCLYEYIAGSLMHRIVCDEINDPALVRLRNLVATDPHPPGIGSTYREARNAKEELILKSVNAVLPLFGKSGFTVPGDRTIVEKLLIQRLCRTLPKRHEYIPYVGEWKTIEWTEQELAAAFKSELKWEALQYDPTIPIFAPAVPDTVAGAVGASFRIEKQPDDFGRERDELDLSGLRWIGPVAKGGGAAAIMLLLWAVYRLVRCEWSVIGLGTTVLVVRAGCSVAIVLLLWVVYRVAKWAISI